MSQARAAEEVLRSERAVLLARDDAGRRNADTATKLARVLALERELQDVKDGAAVRRMGRRGGTGWKGCHLQAGGAGGRWAGMGGQGESLVLAERVRGAACPRDCGRGLGVLAWMARVHVRV